jgi:hypothetical protein
METNYETWRLVAVLIFLVAASFIDWLGNDNNKNKA